MKRIEMALSMEPMVRLLGTLPAEREGRQFHVTARDPNLSVFSFSDTFVLVSHDDSVAGFFQIIVGTALFTSYLMAGQLPVRGSITRGEAEYIPGTSHLVGKALVRAARLEKCQDWFGVILDPEIVTSPHKEILEYPLMKPLVVDYHVPFKSHCTLSNPCKVINWRLNWTVENGIASLFRESSEPGAQKKREETLKFCRWLRDKQLAYQAAYTLTGEKLRVPWLAGGHVGQYQPGAPNAVHGDDY